MDLNLLVAFDALYRERHVTRAGKRLGLSQPATSAALARLRAMFDDELFLRTPHGLEPTARCEALAAPIARALDDLRDAVEPQALDPLTTTVAFRIGAVDAVVAVILRPLATRIAKAAPNAQLYISPCDPSNAVQRLDAREIDVAIVPLHPVPAHVGARPLFPIDLVVVTRRGHPLAGRRIDVDDLLGHPHIVVRFAGPLPSAVDAAFARHGKRRRVALVLASFLAVPHVLVDSDAIALVPGPFGRRLASDGVVACMPLPEELPQPGVTMRMLWPAHADRSPASRWLRERIIETVSAELAPPRKGRARR